MMAGISSKFLKFLQTEISVRDYFSRERPVSKPRNLPWWTAEVLVYLLKFLLSNAAADRSSISLSDLGRKTLW